MKFSEIISLDRLLNIILRFTTLGLRFAFILMLAKFLDPAMVGYYGLFTATVGYAIYFVGMEFYIYTTRAILCSPPDQRGRLIKGQAALSSALYLAVLPLALYLISQKVWPAYLLWWFIPLVMLEHLNQELSRLLIAMSQQVTASLVLFLRQGSWALASLALFFSVPESRNLHLVFGLWAAGGLAATGLGIWKIKQLDISGWREPIDWKWMRQGILISLGFLASTLALRTMYTLDRYWIEALGGFDMVAAYVLFFGIASVLLAFLDAGVFAFIYPDLIRFNHEGEHIKARTLIRRSFLQTVAVCIAFAVISLALLPYILDWIDKPIYHSTVDFYPWLLSAMILNAIGFIPHYALYARGHDKTNIFSHFAAVVVFVVATWIFSQDGSPMAVLIGLNLAFLTVLIIKITAYFLFIRYTDDPVTDHPSTQMKMDGAKS